MLCSNMLAEDTRIANTPDTSGQSAGGGCRSVENHATYLLVTGSTAGAGTTDSGGTPRSELDPARTDRYRPLNPPEDLVRRFILALILGLGSVPATMSAQPIAIVPRPREVKEGDGAFALGAATALIVQAGEPGIRRALPNAIDQLYRLRGEDLPVHEEPAPRDGAIFLGRLVGAPVEDYTVEVTIRRIVLRAGGPTGMVHALATIAQLTQPHSKTVPAVAIEDGPRFPWRGVMLDCCRHFMPVPVIERVLDVMADFKLNRFHWHLTEDQAWRLASDRYPKLTDVGAWRTELDGSTYGGFYTATDAREIVAYARDRGITVVPEIELPGHCRAALAAYPQLSCTGATQPVPSTWGVFDDVYCVGNDEVFTFLTGVLEEVLAIFPSEEIHIGGDEVPKRRWRECPKCQARIAQEHLADEDALQSWFVGRIGHWLAERGRRLVGWDEILAGGDLPPGAIVQSWRGLDGAVATARAGHDVVVSPTSHCYLDYDIGVTDLARAYAFEPVPAALTAAETRHVLGGEMNLWTEYAPDDLVFIRLLPRLLALSEALWSPAPKHAAQAGPQEGDPAIIGRDFTEFWQRAKVQLARLDADGIASGPEGRPIKLAIHRDHDAWRVKTETTGIVPAGERTIAWSPAAASRGVLTEGGAISAQLLIDGTPYGTPATCTLVANGALGCTVAVEPAPDPRYPPAIDYPLTDGIVGSVDYHDGTWLAWEGVSHVTASLDLRRPVHVNTLRLRFLQDANRYIWLPLEVTVRGSLDGKVFAPLGTDIAHTSDAVQDRLVQDFTVEPGNSPRLRYLEITITPRATCPAWHPAAGDKAWVFWGQVMVE